MAYTDWFQSIDEAPQVVRDVLHRFKGPAIEPTRSVTIYGEQPFYHDPYSGVQYTPDPASTTAGLPTVSASTPLIIGGLALLFLLRR